MTRFRLPAPARGALAVAGVAALGLGLLSIPAASAATPAIRLAPGADSPIARPPGAVVSAAVLAAKSRIRAPADQGPITVSLTATRADGGSPLHPEPGQTITLTATTNIDVGLTPWWIKIYNYTGRTLLAACGGGTTCSADVTENSPIAPGQIAFVAYVAAEGGWPPYDVQASTIDNPFEPSWLYPLTMTAYRYGGAGVSLVFSDGGDTTRAPWYIQIYDQDKNEFVARCAMPYGCIAVAPGWEGDYPDPYNAGCGCGYVGTGDGSYSSDTFWAYLAQQYNGTWPLPDLRDWTDHPA